MLYEKALSTYHILESLKISTEAAPIFEIYLDSIKGSCNLYTAPGYKKLHIVDRYAPRREALLDKKIEWR